MSSVIGCVELATQGTVECHGTPVVMSRGGLAGTASDDGYLAGGVGVEAHRTVERAGITGGDRHVQLNWSIAYLQA